MQILLSSAGAALLALLTPWLTDLSRYIALGSSLLAYSLMLVMLSPVGLTLAIGGGMGLTFFLKTRL